MKRNVVLPLISVFFAATLSWAADESEVSATSLILIPPDLEFATRMMVVFDPDEDGLIDKEEAEKLPWRDEITRYDIDRDGKLTHLEVAIRAAFIRHKDDIIQVDYDLAVKEMRRRDRDRNGQLDPDEIANGWPADVDEYDRNKNGVISLQEIAAQLAFERGLRVELGVMGVDHGGAIKLVNRFDKNSDQQLDAGELEEAGIAGEASSFDNDRDGEMSRTELGVMLAHRRKSLGLSKSDQLNARKLMLRLDADRDGKILWTDYGADGPQGNLLVEFRYFDLNGDRVVTEFEVEKKFGMKRKEKGYDDDAASEARRLLIRHDSNRSNSIELDELSDVPALGKLAKNNLKQIDADRDGKLSFFEIAKHLSRAKSD
ncbi:MAG: hypothetical protein F9B45_22235 [Phycisphaera sp. RhM]|nr:hypothetical protein [Phycisphaera sp. RhM]